MEFMENNFQLKHTRDTGHYQEFDWVHNGNEGYMILQSDFANKGKKLKKW